MFLGMFNCELIAFVSELFCVDGEMIVDMIKFKEFVLDFKIKEVWSDRGSSTYYATQNSEFLDPFVTNFERIFLV